MRIAATSSVEVGELVRVVLRDPRWNLGMEMVGTVSRVSFGRRRTDTGPSFAVSFRAMTGWSGYLLSQTLHGRPPVPSSR
jgi:hypothetical protein